jgi:hypothetical protein
MHVVSKKETSECKECLYKSDTRKCRRQFAGFIVLYFIWRVWIAQLQYGRRPQSVITLTTVNAQKSPTYCEVPSNLPKCVLEDSPSLTQRLDTPEILNISTNITSKFRLLERGGHVYGPTPPSTTIKTIMIYRVFNLKVDRVDRILI